MFILILEGSVLFLAVLIQQENGQMIISALNRKNEF